MSEQAKHTAGRWTFRPNNRTARGHIPWGGVIDAPNRRVAEIRVGDALSMSQSHADGQLMAAAPDMLDVLLTIQWSDDVAPSCPYCQALKADGHNDGCELDAAIQKARGT